MANYTRKAVGGAAASYIFIGFTSLMAIFFRIVLAKNLTVDEFGLFYAVLAFVGMFTFLRDLGLSEAQVKFVPRFIHRNILGRIKGLVYLVISVQSVLGTLFFTAFIIAGPALAQHYFKSQQAFQMLVLLGLWFILYGIMESMQFAFNSTHNLALQTSIDFIHLLTALGVTLLLLSKGFGVKAPALAYIAAATITIMLYFPILRFKVFPYFSKTRIILTITHIKEYLRYSLPLVPGSAAIDFLFSKMTVALLTIFGTLSQVAFYTAALSLSKLLRHVYEPIRNVLFPMSSELWEKQDHTRLSDGLVLLFKYALIVTLPLAVSLMVFPEELLMVMFGQDYVAGKIVLQILAPTMVLFTYSTMVEGLFMGIGKTTLTTKQIYVGGVLNTVMGLIFIPLWGMYGAAIALFIAILGRFAYGMTKLRSFISVPLPWSMWGRTTVAAAGFLVTIFVLKQSLVLWVWFEVAISLGAALISYLCLILLLKVVTLEEVKSLIQQVRHEHHP